MKIFEIQLLTSLLSKVKPGLCSDIDVFFSIKDRKMQLAGIVGDHQDAIRAVMQDNGIAPIVEENGMTKYVYDLHPNLKSIQASLSGLNDKSYVVDKISIGRADFKALAGDMVLDEIEFLSELFTIVQ